MDGYWSIDLKIPHATALEVLPGIVDQLRAALAELESDAAEAVDTSGGPTRPFDFAGHSNLTSATGTAAPIPMTLRRLGTPLTRVTHLS